MDKTYEYPIGSLVFAMQMEDDMWTGMTVRNNDGAHWLNMEQCMELYKAITDSYMKEDD